MERRVLPLEHFIRIIVSEDKLAATLRFTRTEERLGLSAKELEEFAVSNGIIYGLDRRKLESIAADPAAFFLIDSTIASGDSPVNGENGYIDYFFNVKNKDKKPLLLEDGTVNYKEIITLQNIQKGQIICRKIPPKPGKDGRAVTGEILCAKAGKEAVFKIGKNVVLGSDQNTIYAGMNGLVTTTERDKMNVFPVYEVNGDVDFRVGNIDFIGNVIVRGSVQPGFRIKAAGDIRITGGVEAAELEAGGSIEISAGIVGQHKAKVKAGKSIKSSFVQDALIEAAEDIIVLQSIMHSTVRAGRAVICNGPKGLIVGGIVQAGEKVISRTIGNSMSTVTAIEVGVVPELRNELLQLRKQLKAHLETMDKTVKALALLDPLAGAGQLSQEKLILRVKLKNTKKQAVQEEMTMKERILEIEKTLEETALARVETISAVYGGTKIVIGRYTKFVKDALSRVVFYISDGDISTMPYM